jgi:hypothetical protein
MSERTYAPRSGGRTAEPRGAATRSTTGQRSTGSRNADTEGSAGRGARHFTGATETGRADTRQSGIRRDNAGGRSRAAREADAVRGRDRATEALRAAGRETDAARAKGRDPGSVRAGTAGGRNTGVRAADATGRRAATAGGPGRRPVVNAPVAGTAALQVDVTAAEPLRVTDPAAAPRLRVAPPAPISAPRAPFVAGVIGVVVAGVLGILLINTKTNENSFQIADLQKQNSALDSQQQDLDNQLVEVSSIGNLDAAARRLGLVKAESPALIRLPDGKLIGVLTPTDGKPAVTAQDPKTTPDAATDKGAANIVPDSGTPGGTVQQQTTPAPSGTVPSITAPTAAVPAGAGK